jgi:hypothetical protein
MSSFFVLRSQIDQLKQLLEDTAEEYKYNFGHPRVLEISQQLDQLIVKMMQYRNRR